MTATERQKIQRVFRFLQLFGISSFTHTGTSMQGISALIAWKNGYRNTYPNPEDLTEILCHLQDPEKCEAAISLGEILFDHGLISIDQIDISSPIMKTLMSSSDAHARDSLQTLLSLKAFLIDQGKIVDELQFHL